MMPPPKSKYLSDFETTIFEITNETSRDPINQPRRVPWVEKNWSVGRVKVYYQRKKSAPTEEPEPLRVFSNRGEYHKEVDASERCLLPPRDDFESAVLQTQGGKARDLLYMEMSIRRGCRWELLPTFKARREVKDLPLQHSMIDRAADQANEVFLAQEARFWAGKGEEALPVVKARDQERERKLEKDLPAFVEKERQAWVSNE